MECPRCKLDMVETEYEGEKVNVCQTCWGYFLTREQLQKVIDKADYAFDKKEKAAVEQAFEEAGDADREGHESNPILCPECRGLMKRGKYHSACPVDIDECEAHGVWLDTGEIKDLQVFIENFLKG